MFLVVKNTKNSKVSNKPVNIRATSLYVNKSSHPYRPDRQADNSVFQPQTLVWAQRHSAV
ncbi:unnamed protein product [Ceratitis capitata]|uniref:(Mediterranean fruit fly) hypothetical protein n=1 Tax=Ceratitis capitata TaxID=7213 RepID=A0A811UYU5_CERCA|nr:unnamed protein product [Ceratitis capitata]